MSKHSRQRAQRRKKRKRRSEGPSYGKGLPSGRISDKMESMPETETFQTQADVLKVDAELGLVLGWAIICKEAGEDYFDLQEDHIPEDAMLEAATDFMIHSRIAKEMHQGDEQGDGVVFAFPMTTEIAKAFGITTPKTGLLVGMKPGADMLEKFKSGELTGFSIGGRRITDEEVDDGEA